MVFGLLCSVFIENQLPYILPIKHSKGLMYLAQTVLIDDNK